MSNESTVVRGCNCPCHIVFGGDPDRHCSMNCCQSATTEEAKDRVAAILTLGPGEIRTGSNAPDGYRLAKKKDSSIILQGHYSWSTNTGMYGGDWKEIPIHILTDEEQGG